MAHYTYETQCRKWILYTAKSNCGRVDRDFVVPEMNRHYFSVIHSLSVKYGYHSVARMYCSLKNDGIFNTM